MDGRWRDLVQPIEQGSQGIVMGDVIGDVLVALLHGGQLQVGQLVMVANFMGHALACLIGVVGDGEGVKPRGQFLDEGLGRPRGLGVEADGGLPKVGPAEDVFFAPGNQHSWALGRQLGMAKVEVLGTLPQVAEPAMGIVGPVELESAGGIEQGTGSRMGRRVYFPQRIMGQGVSKDGVVGTGLHGVGLAIAVGGGVAADAVDAVSLEQFRSNVVPLPVMGFLRSKGAELDLKGIGVRGLGGRLLRGEGVGSSSVGIPQAALPSAVVAVPESFGQVDGKAALALFAALLATLGAGSLLLRGTSRADLDAETGEGIVMGHGSWFSVHGSVISRERKAKCPLSNGR